MDAKTQIRALATAFGVMFGLTAVVIGQVIATGAASEDVRLLFVVMAGVAGAWFAVREVTK